MAQKDFRECQIIAFILSIVLAYNIVPNPISSLFFENGRIPESLTNHILSMYFIGNEPEKIEDYLSFLSKNYETLKSTTFNTSYSQGGSYKCSDTCDYLYIINRCGGATEKSICPFCGNEIGGLNHQTVQRTGHKNLTDAEAVAFLKERVSFYHTAQKTGFNINQNYPIAAVRLMKNKLSYHFLNLITSSIFYFFSVTDLVRLEEFEIVFNLDLESLIKRFSENITQNFNELFGIIQSDEPYILAFSCISQLPVLLESRPEIPLLKEIRNNFEVVVEQTILLEKTPLEMINKYKLLVSSYLKPSDLVNFIEEIDKPPEEQYSHSQFFRILQEPSFDCMIQAFNMSNRQADLKVLDIFLQNFAEIQNLKHFYPLIQFTNYLIEKFTFAISRAEASSIPISTYIEDDNKLAHLFETFKKS